MLSLRPYQRASLDALYEHWQDGGGNGLIVLPTGAGKALAIAALVRETLERWPDLRICIVTHVRELVSQNFKELLGYWPGAPAGIYSAGLGRRDTHSRILFCGMQSVWNKVGRLGGFDLVIVDEAHLIPRSSDTSYGKFLSGLQAVTPDMRVVGLTATPYRLDSGRLDEGDGRIFERIVFEANVGDLIRDEYLSPLVSKATATSFDLTGVGKRGGDYIPGQLEAAVNHDDITQSAVSEMVALGQDRRAWLAFCAGVKHAEAVRDAIRARGLTCEAVSGETPSGQRDAIINAFRAGRIRCLTSVGVLSTGFNVPHVDLVALLRPTASTGLYVQQVGRALRRAPGKTDALILDYAGLVKAHGPIDAITARGKPKAAAKEGEEEVRAKECPDCRSLVALNTRICTTCGHEWIRDEAPRHDAVADAVHAILSLDGPPWLTVTGMSFARHTKPGSPDSLRAEFHCGVSTYRLWVCLEHGGTAARKACDWWRRMGGGEPPATVEEGLARADDLVWPHEIQVRQAGKFWEVVGYRFAAGEGWSSRAVRDFDEAA
ncbi:DEAD/DEAH box helicase [Methylobacterium durans]|uniref:ATP-dependent helicase n=1 Tax=Methylobacterium durans TaxID=2202825 RepID=A0A2U8WAG8_9HYPH|nr:DEAD/DEAH box helicase [Methylobacterium durans]AWN43144.1 ATP-dependent helicase [Methylobacterium durans]